jgi:hypothetical protein
MAAVAWAASSGSTPLRCSCRLISARDKPRSRCRAETKSVANVASSTSPTAASRLRTCSAASSGMLRLVSAVSSSARVRARTASWFRQIVCAAATGSVADQSGGSSRPGRERGEAAPRFAPDQPEPCSPWVAVRRATTQKSTGAGSGASSLTRAPMPSFSLIFFSISLARSGLSRRKLRTFSLPWPSWSPS